MCRYTHVEEKKEPENQTADIEDGGHKGEIQNLQEGFWDDDVMADRDTKLQIVLQHVKENCKLDSEHSDVRYICEALHNGDTLEAKVISGGYTNYSYQLFLKNEPEKKLFAKICFAYALWCPGKKIPYDLDRQRCEFNLMKEFSESLTSGDGEESPVVTPYFLLNVDNQIRILVSQWASTDEQWGNQFIDGEVDRRTLPNIATTMAKVGLAKVDDKNLNQNMLTDLRGMFAGFGPIFANLFAANPNPDKCVEYLSKVGKERLAAMQEAAIALEDKKECTVHADAHVFNMLVEAKPRIDENLNGQFGVSANVVICDWEMAHIGCHGLDLGMLFYIPITCAYLHAAKGYHDKAQHILNCLDEIWDVYATYMVQEGGKGESFLRDAFLNMMGFCGQRLFGVMYVTRGQVELLDTTDLTKEDVDRVIASVGLSGVQFQEFGFLCVRDNCDMGLAGVREWYTSHLQEMISSITEDFTNDKSTSTTKTTRRRRSSLLRASGRRISDSSFGTFRSLSVLNLDPFDSDFDLYDEA